MNVFLIEKKSSLNKHRVNLCLARFSTVHRKQGDSVFHFVMDSKTKLPADIKPNRIYISIVFSWDVIYFVKLVNELKKLYNLDNKDIIIGGVCTLYMREYIVKATGIIPNTGVNMDLDHVIPDSTMYDDDCTYLFTMRSCPNKCSYCTVNNLEPEYYVIENWKEQINLNSKYIIIQDNNLLSAPIEHRKEVFEYLTDIANIKGTKIPGSRKLREVIFDSGLDFRNMTKENLEMMKTIKFAKIKIAFDDVRYEKSFDIGIRLLLDYYPKVSKRGIHENIECYVLYNCPDTKDTIESTLYRIYKLRYYYGVNAYAMRYQPLDTLKYKTYVSPFWNEGDCVDIGRWVNDRNVFMPVKRYKYYIGRKEDGKCISSFTAAQKIEFLNKVSDEVLPFNFSNGYDYNLPFIKEELALRRPTTNQTNCKREYEQLEFHVV
jgi:hypothetical protein